MPAATTTALRSDLRRMATRTADLKAEASAILSLAEAKQWVWSPDGSTWSMALTLDHLNSVNRLLLPRLEEALKSLRSEGYYLDTEPRYGPAERFIIRLLSPNPPFHLPVPPIYVPKLPADPAREIGEPFLELLDRIQAAIVAANGLDLKRVKIASPASPMLRLTAGAWLEGTVAHNEYHWMQVRALLDHPNFPPR